MGTPGQKRLTGRVIAVALAAVCLGGRLELPVEASELEEDHQLSMEFVTPHTKWAQPYAGGQTRVLVFIDADNHRHPSLPFGTLPREIIELKQRFELDAAAVYWINDSINHPSTRPPDHWLHGTNGVQRMLDLLTESWDCYVLYQVSLEWLPVAAQATLLANVNAGSGLVGVGTNDNGVLIGGNLLDPLPEFLAEGTPFIGLPFVQETVLTGLEPEEWTDAEAARRMMSAYGVASGRGVRIIDRPQLGADIGWDTEYEYWAQLLGRAVLWAARQEPEMTLSVEASLPACDRSELPGQEITVTWAHPDPPPGLEIEASLRRFDGQVTPLQVKQNVAGTGTFTCGVPDLRADRYFVDVRARGTSGEESWASTTFAVTSARRVASLELDAPYSEIGGTLSGNVSLEGAPLAGERVRIDLVDSRNRIVARSDLGAGQLVFEFDVEPWMPMLTRVVARLLAGGQEVDHQYAYFHVTKRHRGQFNFVMWDYPWGTLGPWAERALARCGVTVQLPSGNPPNQVAANEIAWVPYTVHIQNTLADNGIMAETGCWNDPSRTGPRVNQVADDHMPSRQHGVFAYSLGDEIAVRGSCLSTYCLSAYREYLEQEYGSIEALNASWGSSYNSFDEILLLDSKDNDGAVARSLGIYPRWYDRQAYQCYNICTYYGRFGAAFSGIDPEAWTGFEGASQFHAADDYDLIIRTNQWWAPAAGLGDELIRSLAPSDFQQGNWIGHQKTAHGLLAEYWRAITRGCDSIWWWTWYILESHHGFLAPSWTPFDATKDLLADTEVVRNGLGTLLSRSQRLDDGIAILYSHPSGYATRVETGPSYSRYDSMHSFWVRTLRELHLEFRYVSDRMLRLGEFDPASAKVLVLAQAEAIGPVEATVIRGFVEAGGTVIADVRPGIYTDRCKPRSDSVLADLFGIEATGDAVTEFCVYWGTADQGQTTNWPYSECLSGVGTGMYSIVASNLSPNTAYYYIGRATNEFAEAWTPVQRFVTAGGLPFEETFDPRSLGPLDWQNGWRAEPSAAAQVEATTNGIDQICRLDNGTLWHAFSGPSTTNIVWVDLSTRPARGYGPSSPLGTAANPAAAAFYVRAPDGYVVVFDGTNRVALTSKPAIPINMWARFTVRADYGKKQWDLYVNGTNVALNLGFYSTAAERIRRLKGTDSDYAEGSALIDDIYVGTAPPEEIIPVMGGEEAGDEDEFEFGAATEPDTNSVPGAPVIGGFEATGVTHNAAWFSVDLQPIRPAAAQEATATISGPFGNATLDGILCDPGVFVADGQAYGTAGDIPVVIVKEVGAGRAVLLNFSMAGTPDPLLEPLDWGEYHKYYSYHSWIAKAADPEESAEFLRELLAWVGVVPALQVSDKASGGRIPNLEVTRWTNGQIQIISLFRWGGGDGEDALIELPVARNVYNLRSGEDLGSTASLAVPIVSPRATFLVLAPEAVPDVELALSTHWPARGQVVRLTATVPGAAGLHAVRVRVKTPAGEVAEWLNRELMVDSQGQGCDLPVAFNDAVGIWTVEATDLCTGRTITTEYMTYREATIFIIK